MIPNIDPVRLPIDRGTSAKTYLAHHGLVAAQPPIRSSDFELIHRPFTYYLSRRLGIVPALEHSEALSRGSWFHSRIEHIGKPDGDEKYLLTLGVRLKELRAMCDVFSMPDSYIDAVLEREKRDAQTVLAWYRAVMRLRIPNAYLQHGLEHYITHPNHQCLGTELILRVNLPEYPVPLVAAIDRLIYNKKTNTLKIVDYKTTGGSTTTRLQTCRVETQTYHYAFVLSKLLPQLIDMYGLPKDVKFGSMVHVAIAKPTIEFGQNDRPYSLYVAGKRTKPWRVGRAQQVKGGWLVNLSLVGELGEELETKPPVVRATEQAAYEELQDWANKKPERDYASEPELPRYAERCYQWYTGTGDYANLAEGWTESPPINISEVAFTDLFGSDFFQDYLDQLDRVVHYATCDPIPSNFYRTASGMGTARHLTPYAPFYVSPVCKWPHVVRDGRFVQRWRDEPDASSDSMEMSDV